MLRAYVEGHSLSKQCDQKPLDMVNTWSTIFVPFKTNLGGWGSQCIDMFLEVRRPGHLSSICCIHLTLSSLQNHHCIIFAQSKVKDASGPVDGKIRRPFPLTEQIVPTKIRDFCIRNQWHKQTSHQLRSLYDLVLETLRIWHRRFEAFSLHQSIKIPLEFRILGLPFDILSTNVHYRKASAMSLIHQV